MKDYKIAGISSKYYIIVIVLTLMGLVALPFLGVYGLSRDVELSVFVVLVIFTGVVTLLRRLAHRIGKLLR
jgi:hypothetical protein